MKNNIRMEDAFNPNEISIQKVLNESNTALFQFEDHVSGNNRCLVRQIGNQVFKLDKTKI